MDAFPQLRPLIIVTGSVVFQSKGKQKASASSQDRNAAAVLVAKVKRHLLRISLFETPYGFLVIADRLKEVRRLMRDIAQEVREFNNAHTACQLENVLLWEHLEGNRLIAVGSWIQANPTVDRVAEAMLQEPTAEQLGQGFVQAIQTSLDAGYRSASGAAAPVELLHAPAGLPPSATLHAAGQGDLAVPGSLGSAESGTRETTGTTTLALGHEPESTPPAT